MSIYMSNAYIFFILIYFYSIRHAHRVACDSKTSGHLLTAFVISLLAMNRDVVLGIGLQL